MAGSTVISETQDIAILDARLVLSLRHDAALSIALCCNYCERVADY